MSLWDGEGAVGVQPEEVSPEIDLGLDEQIAEAEARFLEINYYKQLITTPLYDGEGIPQRVNEKIAQFAREQIVEVLQPGTVSSERMGLSPEQQGRLATLSQMSDDQLTHLAHVLTVLNTANLTLLKAILERIAADPTVAQYIFKAVIRRPTAPTETPPAAPAPAAPVISQSVKPSTVPGPRKLTPPSAGPRRPLAKPATKKVPMPPPMPPPMPTAAPPPPAPAPAYTEHKVRSPHSAPFPQGVDLERSTSRIAEGAVAANKVENPIFNQIPGT